jgi:hypothetical protein
MPEVWPAMAFGFGRVLLSLKPLLRDLVARTAAPSARPLPSQPLLVCILQQGAAVIGGAANQAAGAWSLRSIREERFVRDREKRKTDRFF